MSLHERIEPEITGDAAEKKNRKELLRLIVDAFAKGGQELVTSELAAEMEEIEKKFDGDLAKLDANL